jgi:peptide/nickel transport system permease protein
LLNHIIKRILYSLPILFLISLLVFFMIKLIPGDPIELMFGKEPNREQIELIRKFYNFDKPLIQQYLIWLRNMLSGNWGQSITLNEPVILLIMERLPRTALLCFSSILVSITFAIFAGIISAAKHNTIIDLGLTTLSLIFISIPSFFVGIMLIIIFSVNLHLLPATGYVSPFVSISRWIHTMIMPTITLGATLCASTTRFLRSSMLEILNQDYVRLARAKGNKEKRVLYIHSLRNALIPVVTQVGMQIGFLLGGEVVIEKVFGFPGLGLLMINALQQRDYPLIQACIMIFAILVIFVNILVDIIYTLVDPRISFSKKVVD